MIVYCLLGCLLLTVSCQTVAIIEINQTNRLQNTCIKMLSHTIDAFHDIERRK